jgi:hypothetical protein
MKDTDCVAGYSGSSLFLNGNTQTALREKDGALTQAHREKDEALTQARSKEEEADQARRDKDELASNYQVCFHLLCCAAQQIWPLSKETKGF